MHPALTELTTARYCKKISRTAKTQTENSKQIFPEKELRSLIHIHVSVSDLCIPRIGSAYSAAGKNVDRFWEYIYRSQIHECGNWD
jgi:hypothetical protein